MAFKGVDNLRLVETAREFSFIRRADESDTALGGFLGFGFVAALILSFAVAYLASLVGVRLEVDDVTRPIAIALGSGIAYFVCWITLSDWPRVVRSVVVVVSALSLVISLGMVTSKEIGHWYLYLPVVCFILFVALLAIRQLLIGAKETGE